MDRRAAREVPWALLTYAASRGINVLTTIALARLVTPHEFGLVALAALTIQTVSMFNDLGLGGALITRQDLDRRAMGTMLTLMVGMHALITVVLIACAPLIADIFHEPRLTAVLMALAGTVVLGGASWFQEALLQRELRFKRRFVGQVLQSGTYAVVALALGFAGAGVWAIVIGQAAAILVYAIAMTALAPYRIRPAFDRATARMAFRAGRGFMLQGGLEFFRRNVDYFAVGRFLGAQNLGYYSMAYRLGELPYAAIADPVARVSFPAFARMHAAREEIAPAYLTTLRLVALFACPLGILLSATADPFTRVVFGDAWLPMIPALTVIGVWAALRPLQGTVGWLLNSIGDAGVVATVSAIVLVPFVAGVVLAADRGGITAVAWVVLAESVVSLLALAVLVDRRGGVRLGRQWRALRPVVAGCVAAWPSATLVADATSAAPAIVSLFVTAAGGAVVYVAVVSTLAPGTFTYALARARSMLGGPPVGLAETS
jgi:lipopolysaccharide exporter